MKYRNIIIILLTIMITYGCQPDSLEFSKPKNLVGTIYSQLESLGNFEYYLKCLDQTPYVKPLKKGGAWTVFVPTDEAFEKFMKDNGYSSFESIPSARVKAIVEFTLISEGYNTTALAKNFQWADGGGFKRDTQFRDSVVAFDEVYFKGFENMVPGEYLIDQSFGRTKPIQYLLPRYIEDFEHHLEGSDYDFMFPNKTQSYVEGDMKVQDAHVVNKDVVAENGFIHVLDKVVEPRPNLYQNLSSDEYQGKYSIFRSIVNRFGLLNNNAGMVLNEDTGEMEQHYYITFHTGVDNNNLAFNVADDLYPRNFISRTNLHWEYSPGMLVPTDEALTNYLDPSSGSILGDLYTSYDDMPLDVLAEFININFFTHYWSICPSHTGRVFSVAKDQINYDAVSDVVDRKFCSNGFFVGVDKVYESASFGTVVGPLFLNPEYSIMFSAIKSLGLDNSLTSLGANYSIFGIKNDQFVEVEDPNNEVRKITAEIDVDGNISLTVTGDPNPSNNRKYPENPNSPASGDVAYVTNTLKSIVENQIVEQSIALGANNYYQTKTGEFIYVGSGNRVSGGGDIYNNKVVEVTKENVMANGSFYEMNSFIERPLHYVYGSLVNAASDFSQFINVLESADALIGIINNPDDRLLSLIASNRSYTLLAPSNAAVDQAVADGVIPNPDPAYIAGLDELDAAIAKKQLKEFAQRHFLQRPIPTDGNTAGDFRSLYVKEVVNFSPIYQEFTVENDYANSSLTVKDQSTGALITTTNGVTNLLSKKVVIHEIDNYLK